VLIGMYLSFPFILGVMADWCRVLESIKAGKRLSESKFAVLDIAPKGQRSVVGMSSR